MNTNAGLCKFRFIGELVETFTNEEQKYAKVSIKHICVELPVDYSIDTKLGDPIVLETSIQIESLLPLLVCGLTKNATEADIF